MKALLINVLTSDLKKKGLKGFEPERKKCLQSWSVKVLDSVLPNGRSKFSEGTYIKKKNYILFYWFIIFFSLIVNNIFIRNALNRGL